MTPFHIPYQAKDTAEHVLSAINSRQTAGNGPYTKQCQTFFENEFGFEKCLLTTSCTDALELGAMLVNIGPGDEVIFPSYTFASGAQAFIRQGAIPVFADSEINHPNINVDKIESRISERTKAIVVTHYAGVSCNMHDIMSIAKKHDLKVIEDAAQCIDAFYQDRPLGGIGHFGAISFHQTKNIQCGEGGLACINDPELIERAEVLWEKGTNRLAFFRGQVDKYNWIDVGSSFLPSDIIAAYLFAQLGEIETVTKNRLDIWNRYYGGLSELESAYGIQLPTFRSDSQHNAHIFYLTCRSLNERTELIRFLKQNGHNAYFHYQALHQSPYFAPKHDGTILSNANRFSDMLVRLPIYPGISQTTIDDIISLIYQYYKSK